MSSNNTFWENQLGPPNVQQQYMFTPQTINKCAWSMSMMPWSSPPDAKNNGIMEFKALNSKCEPKVNIHCKRKTETESPIPSKQIITEEKMIAHLQKLHISVNDNFHNNTDKNQSLLGTTTFNVDLEKKIKNARTITVCEEVRKLHNPDSIIPKALLNRMEKPCTALVLWQPQNVLHAITDEHIEEDCDNKNNSNIDNSYCMDLDV